MFDISSWNKNKTTLWHLCCIFFFAFSITGVYLLSIDWHKSNVWFITLWTVLFLYLSLNLGYCISCSIISVLAKPKILPAKDLSNLDTLSKIAIVYCVKNEGENLFESMLTSFRDNYSDNVDLILLSNSTEEDKKAIEQDIFERLQDVFGESKVFYSLQSPPKHMGLNRWLKDNSQYKYAVICDADSYLPNNSVDQLLSKAEHELNQKTVIFQSRLNIRRPLVTGFHWLLGPGQDICQRIYTKANSIVLENDVFYGSGALIRVKEFSKLDIPKNVLSHDIWDTTMLDNNGFKTSYCYDIITFEGFPNNYMEIVRREARWFKGSLQSLALLKLPKISLSMKFQVIHPVYNYVAQLVFVTWLTLGLVRHLSFSWGMGLVYFTYESAGAILYEIVMGILLLHRYIGVRSIRGVWEAIRETIGSSVIYLNGVYYTSLVVLFSRGTINTNSWVPTQKKQKDLTLLECVEALWQTTLIGLGMIYFLVFQNQQWLLWAMPFVISFGFGIPITYLTARTMLEIKQKIRQYIAPAVGSFLLISVVTFGLNFSSLTRLTVLASVQLGINCPNSVRLGQKYSCTFSVPGQTNFPLLKTKYHDVIPNLIFYANTNQKDATVYSSQSPLCRVDNTRGDNIEIICTDIPTDNYQGILKAGWSEVYVGIVAPKALNPTLNSDVTIGWFSVGDIKIVNEN